MRALGIAVGACALTIGCAWADNHSSEEEPTAIVPVEIYACNYLDGKGPEDLGKANAFWNKWADKAGMDKYFAMTMVPVFYGEDTFDVAWLGVWADGEAMGSGLDSWLSSGGEASEKFAEVVDCHIHANFATMRVKAPPEDSPDNLFLEFSDCKVNEGVDWDEMFGGMVDFGDYSAERGYKNGTWVMFPMYGGGKEEFDFKVVNSWRTMADAGAAFDMYGTGGDWRKSMEMSGGDMMCDSSRVYAGTVVRRPTPTE